MPIYEYSCSDCHLRFELVRPVSQAGEDAKCPRCQASAKRVFSTFNAVSKDDHGFSKAYLTNPGEELGKG